MPGDGNGSDVTDATTLSSPTSPSGTKVPPRGAENRRSLKSVKIQESDNTDIAIEEKSIIQHRPLPEIPPTSTKV